METLSEALNDSIEIHQRSDVPYGMFLSGGIDSSVLLALMSELNEQPVKTFTAGFEGTSVIDEREHAKLIAEYLGAETVDVDISRKDFSAIVRHLCWQVFCGVSVAPLLVRGTRRGRTSTRFHVGRSTLPGSQSQT